MKRVVVEVMPIRDGESVTASMAVQKKKGDAWNQTNLYDVTSGTPEAKRSFLMEDDERLIIEGKSNTTVIMDHEQNAARHVPSDPEKREEKLAQEAAEKDKRIADEAKSEAQKEAERRANEAAKPRTNLGNPVPLERQQQGVSSPPNVKPPVTPAASGPAGKPGSPPAKLPGTPLSGQAPQPPGVETYPNPSTEGSLGTGKEGKTSAPGSTANANITK